MKVKIYCKLREAMRIGLSNPEKRLAWDRALQLFGNQRAVCIASVKGRKPLLDAEQSAKLKALSAAGVAKTEIAKRLNVSLTTVYRYLAA